MERQRIYENYPKRSRQQIRLRRKSIIAERIKKAEIENKLKRKKFVTSFLGYLMAGTIVFSCYNMFNYDQKITNLNSQITSLKKENNVRQADIDYYNIQLMPYKDKHKIQEIARVSLGMDYPTRNQMLYVDYSGTENNAMELTSNR